MEREIKVTPRLFKLHWYYVVMPPAHGKSTYHNQIENLLEADTLYNRRGDPELAELRKTARMTGNWQEYDAAWATRLKPLIDRPFAVIMVPNKGIGDALGAEWLASYQLADEAWGSNLRSRGKTVHNYEYAKSVDQKTMLVSNNDLLRSFLITDVNRCRDKMNKSMSK